jgi:hypothetical protein
MDDLRPSLPDNSPAWRWQLVTRYADEQREPPSSEDALVAPGSRFLRRWQNAKTVNLLSELRAAYPDLYTAHNIWSTSGAERWMLEAALLTEADFNTIGEYLARAANIVRAFCQYFYDVVERKKSRGYVLAHIMAPSVSRPMNAKDQDFLPKLVGYCAGWKALTEYFDRGSFSTETRAWFQAAYTDQLLRLGWSATQRVELNNFTAVPVMEMTLKMAELQQAHQSLGSNDAMTFATSLMDQYKMLILPPNKALAADEPRAADLLQSRQRLAFAPKK